MGRDQYVSKAGAIGNSVVKNNKFIQRQFGYMKRKEDGTSLSDQFTRRHVIAGATGLVALGGIGVAKVSSRFLNDPVLLSFSGRDLTWDSVDLEADVPIEVTATNTEYPDRQPDIRIRINHPETEGDVIDENSKGSVTASGRTARSGLHRVTGRTEGEFEVEVRRGD